MGTMAWLKICIIRIVNQDIIAQQTALKNNWQLLLASFQKSLMRARVCVSAWSWYNLKLLGCPGTKGGRHFLPPVPLQFKHNAGIHPIALHTCQNIVKRHFLRSTFRSERFIQKTYSSCKICCSRLTVSAWSLQILTFIILVDVISCLLL